MARLFATLLLVASGCGGTDPSDRVCTEIGCGSSGAEFQLGTFSRADVTPAAMSAAQVDVCLNNVCSLIALGQLPSSNASIDIRGPVVIPNVLMTVTLAQTPQDAISIIVNVQGPDAMPFDNGDVYHVTVRSQDNRVLADRSWIVDYELRYPNGEQCEPACAQATTITEL